MIKALIFDFDGTILDTETPEFYAWQHVYREHGAELGLNEWVRGVGAIGAFDPYDHLQAFIDGPIDRDDIAARVRAHHQPVIQAQQPRDGILALFEQAHAHGLRMAVASSATHDWVDTHLQRLGLYHHFQVVKCRDDVAPGRAKPHPDIYLATLQALAVDAAEAVAIEDSLNGMRAAKAAGIFTIVTPNPVTAQIDFAQADLVLASAALIDLSRFQLH